MTALTAWQDPDSCPHTTLPAHLGTASCPAVPTLSSLDTTAEAARDLYKHQSDHIPDPSICCLPPAPQRPARSCMTWPPSLPPCSSFCPSLEAIPQAACSCPRTMHCGSLWVFAWLALFLIQVWALLPPPQGGPPEAASSDITLNAAVPVPRALRNGPALVLACLSVICLLCWTVNSIRRGPCLYHSQPEGGLSRR